MGGKSSSQSSTVKVVPDKQTQQMNALALQQAQYLQPFRQQAAQQVGQYLTPKFSVAPDLLTNMFGATPVSGATGGLSTSPTYAAALKPYGSMLYSTPEQAAAAGTLLSMTDVGPMSKAMSDYYNTVVAPSIMANLTASGMGRGGAPAQAASLASTQYTLPLLQQQQANMANLANYVSNLGQSRSELAYNLANPQNMPFHGGQTQTSNTTTTQPFNPFGMIGSILTAPMTGGGSLIGNVFGSLMPTSLGFI